MSKRKHDGRSYDLREKISPKKPKSKRRVVFRPTIRRKVTVHNEQVKIDKPFMEEKRLTYDFEENDYHKSKRLKHTCQNNNLLRTALRNASPIQVFYQEQSLTLSYKSRGSSTENFPDAKYISCAETNLTFNRHGALQQLKEKQQAYTPDNCSARRLLQSSIEDSVALGVKQGRLASAKLTSHLPTSKMII